MLTGMKAEGRDRGGRGSPGRADGTRGTGIRSHPVASSGGRERQENTTVGWSDESEAPRKEETL